MSKLISKLASLPLTLALAAGLCATPRTALADSSPFIGEMKIVGFNFCPRGWAAADGQLLAISQYSALFSILGTQFGGDGRTTFALPDLRGRVVVGQGSGPGLPVVNIGERFGTVTTNMSALNLPAHSHRVNANNLDGDRPGPGNKLLAAAPTGGTGNETIYSLEPPNRTMNTSMISQTGAGQSFDVTDPKLGILHCIALEGIFPSRS